MLAGAARHHCGDLRTGGVFGQHGEVGSDNESKNENAWGNAVKGVVGSVLVLLASASFAAAKSDTPSVVLRHATAQSAPLFYTPGIPAGGGSAQKSPANDKKAGDKKPSDDPMNTPPISFYIAKGDADACGPGCSEWIVADGRFVFGATEKFRAVLKQAGNRKLPVFFNSPGGEVRAATSLGRVLRQQGITASVGKTTPSACAGLAADACRKLLKKPDGPVPARVASYGGQCNSACVYALIGAKTREVAPDAVIGVHAVSLKLTVKVFRGHELSQSRLNAMAKSRLNDVNENLRGYVREMGIDPELFDLALGTSPNRVHVLTRDEIATYGIDTRKAVESPWSIVGGAQPVLIKTIAEAKTTPGRKYRSSMIVFTCDRGTGRTLIHGREIDSGEESTILVSAVYGLNNFAFPASGRTMRIGEMFYLTRSARIPRNFFAKAADAEASFDILEGSPSGTLPLVRKYPVQNLAKSLDDLEQSCARGTSAQAQTH